jgi:uncharacterized phage protein (TIGR02216 family)
MAAAGGAAGEDRQGTEARFAPFPWDAVLHAGLCLLRLPPADFWALTPVEFFVMTGGTRPRGMVTGRAELDELMQAFPDG